MNWGTWSSWNKKAAYDAVDRSYDYPHVAALHWSMYRLARNYKGLVTNHPWDWYLDHAYQTSLAMVKFAPQYAQYGQMEGTIFLEILQRPATRRVEDAGRGAGREDEGARRSVEQARLSLRQRDAVGLHRTGRGLRAGPNTSATDRRRR